MELTITNIWPYRDTLTIKGTVRESTRSGWIKITPKQGTAFTVHWMDVSDSQGRFMTHPNFGKLS